MSDRTIIKDPTKTTNENKHREKQFISLVSRLSAQFPNLDLRFNLEQGSSCFRYKVADCSNEIFELELGNNLLEDTFHQAIFQIKKLAQLFDS